MTNLPVTGLFKITCEYHKKGSRWAAGHHTGIDIVSFNKKVYGTCDGKVVKVGFDKSYGNHVVVYNDSDDTYHWFCHLASYNVKLGDKITRTTVIGKMGETGNANGVHLHFEIRTACNRYDMTSNPAAYMGIPNKVGLYNSNNYQINNKKSKEGSVVYIDCKDTGARNDAAHAALIEIESDIPFTGSCTKQIWVYESTLSKNNTKVRGVVAYDGGDRFIIELDTLQESAFDKQVWISKGCID